MLCNLELLAPIIVLNAADLCVLVPCAPTYSDVVKSGNASVLVVLVPLRPDLLGYCAIWNYLLRLLVEASAQRGVAPYSGTNRPDLLRML